MKEPLAVDATGCRVRAPAGCAASCAAATALLGIDGLLVTAVTVTGDGLTVAEVVTDPACEQARRCPECGTSARRVKDNRVTTRPRDVFTGDRQVLLRWRKKRWACGNRRCRRKSFTESLPGVRARARLTARLRTRPGQAIGDDLMPAAAAARRYGVSDRTVAAAFTAYAEEQLAGLDEQHEPGEAAGIDEFRRGAPGPAPASAGEAGQARSEWFTHLVDLGTGGSLGLAQGRTAEAEKERQS